MAWDTKLSDDSTFIEINYTNNATAQELKDALAEISSMAKKTGVQKFLADCTQMQGGHSVFDIYFLLDLYQKFDIQKTIKEAVLFSNEKDNKEKVKFYETASLNKGYNVRIFSNRDEAVKWLCE